MILLKVGIKQIDNNNNNSNNKQSLYLNMIIPLHLIHEKKGEFWYWTECTNSYIYKMSNTNLFLSNFIFIKTAFVLYWLVCSSRLREQFHNSIAWKEQNRHPKHTHTTPSLPQVFHTRKENISFNNNYMDLCVRGINVASLYDFLLDLELFGQCGIFLLDFTTLSEQFKSNGKIPHCPNSSKSNRKIPHCPISSKSNRKS
jgi:hypothetical protein